MQIVSCKLNYLYSLFSSNTWCECFVVAVIVNFLYLWLEQGQVSLGCWAIFYFLKATTRGRCGWLRQCQSIVRPPSTPLSSFNVNQWNRSRGVWPASGHDIISATCCSCYMQCVWCEWVNILRLQRYPFYKITHFKNDHYISSAYFLRSRTSRLNDTIVSSVWWRFEATVRSRFGRNIISIDLFK
jgi:hypothetical protein